MSGDKLSDYPCAIELDATRAEWSQACRDDCSNADICVAFRIYCACIAMRRALTPLNSAALDELPCYHGSHDPGYMCSGRCRDRVDTGEWKCVVLPVYRAHIALRAAILRGMTPREAARVYRDAAKMYGVLGCNQWDALRLNDLADVVESMSSSAPASSA